jgi:23S rRNA (guanosine2251-2'-O)-methyltransferase
MKQLTPKELKKFFKNQFSRNKEIVLLLENIQYERNTASIFRTADAAGVKKIYLTGVSKTPPFDESLEHVSRRKEGTVDWEYQKNAYFVLQNLKKQGFITIAVEITTQSLPLEKLKPIANANDKICFVLGSEMFGVTNDTLRNCDESVYIPMYGKGASLNVAVSAGIVLYSL